MLARVVGLAEANLTDALVTFLVPIEFLADASVTVGGLFDIDVPNDDVDQVTPKIRADLRRAARRRKRAKQKRGK